MIKLTPAIENCMVAAHSIGCDRDQILKFFEFGYVPIPRGLEFHQAAREIESVEGQAIVGYGGSRGTAKTHAVIAQVALDDCQRYPGLSCLYLRKTKSSAKKQLGDIMQKVTGVPPKDGVVRFQNGSTITIGGFKDSSQLASIIGIEYDRIIIEDATTIDADSISKILGSLRTAKGIKPIAYMPSNPGSIGHAWYKKLLYDPYKQKREINTRFIHAQSGDNPFIDPGYQIYLNSLVGLLRSIWRDGDFEVAAGQYFTTFDEDIHVIPPFPIDIHQTYWLAMDYGYQHWNVALLACRLGEKTYIVDEVANRKLLPEQNAANIIAMLGRHGLKPYDLHSCVAGHDIWAERGNIETIVQQFAKAGLQFTQAKIDRINGAVNILKMLGNPKPTGEETHIEPTLFIFDRCRGLIEQLPQMIHDEKRPEDVLKVDADVETGIGGDDIFDTLKYLLREAISGGGYAPSPVAGYRG